MRQPQSFKWFFLFLIVPLIATGCVIDDWLPNGKTPVVDDGSDDAADDSGDEAGDDAPADDPVDEGDGGGDEVASTITAPDLADVLTALSADNANGMVVGTALTPIVLPICTEGGTDFTVTYSIPDLPVWLQFDATTRTVSMADGDVVLDAAANTAAAVTYTCEKSDDATVTDSVAFTINDADAGGVIDDDEFAFGEVPLVNPNVGTINLNPTTAALYGSSLLERPMTGIVATAVGMSATTAADDTSDFDGDTITNSAEITAGSNVFVATTIANIGAAVNYTEGSASRGLGTGDFDGDGDLDIVSLDPASDELFIILGAGDGTFAGSTSIAVGNNPHSLIVLDLNGDTDLDVVVSNKDGDNISVLLGDGAGGFAAAVNTALTSTDPEALTAADFNGDGFTDVAVAHNDAVTPRVAVLLGNGAGVLTLDDSVVVDGQAVVDVVAADLNADGDVDLATVDFGGNMKVLEGDGTGAFTVVADDYAPGMTPVALVAGDVDGDGDIDIITGNRGGFNFTTFTNAGDAEFDANTFTGVNVSLGGGIAPRGMMLADLDGDNDLDLSFVTSGNNLIGFLNDGSGGWDEGADGEDFSVATSGTTAMNTAVDIVAADFDSDGDLDLAHANNGFGDEEFSVYLNSN